MYNLSKHPLFLKYRELFIQGIQVGFAQSLVQAFGFGSSILIIHVLNPENYALYTLAYTILGSMTVLADSGIGKGVMAQGGKVWTDSNRLGSVLATGLKLRRQFAVVAIAVTIPPFGYLLKGHGAGWQEIIAIMVAVLPLFYIQLSDSLLRIVPELHQRVGELQSIAVRTNVLRLLLICLTLVLLPYAAAIILATGLATAWGNSRHWLLTRSICPISQAQDPEVRKQILKVVKRMMPGSIFYCLSGSLSIWLISVFGDTDSLASVGALSRVSQLMILFSSILGMIAVPRFARCPESKPLLFARFVQVQVIAWGIGCLLVATFYIAPEKILLLLGDDYSDLTAEVFIQAIVMAASFINMTIVSLASARGWILPPVPQIALAVAGQVAGIILFDCSTVIGVLMVSLIPQLLLIVARNVHTFAVIYKID